MSRPGRWQRRQLWVPAVVFVVANVGLLVGYGVALAGKLGLQAGRLESRQKELAELRAQRVATEALLARGTSTRQAIEHLYRDRLGSEAARLTLVMLEVKKLARQAGLSGMEAISYADLPEEDLPLVKKRITFAARGDYQQLRAFINLLEVSESFLTLEEIAVDDAAERSGQLELQVELSTLFAVPGRRPGART